MESSASLTLRQDHLDQLRSLVLPNDRHEGAALLLCSTAVIDHDPWTGLTARRFLSRDVIAIAPDDIIASSGVHITVRTQSLVRALRRARDESLVAGFVHSHPQGPAVFSEQDDSHEPLLAELARNRNGRATPFLSVLTTGEVASALVVEIRSL